MRPMSEFLTTREVATLLRIKERKVYELVSQSAIPAATPRERSAPEASSLE